MTRFLLGRINISRDSRVIEDWALLRYIVGDPDHRLSFSSTRDALSVLVEDVVPHHLEWCRPIPDPMEIVGDEVFSMVELRAILAIHHDTDAVRFRMEHPQFRIIEA